MYKLKNKLPAKIEFSLYRGLSLWQAIHRELLGDTLLESWDNISVGNFSSEMGASSMKKFEVGFCSTSFSRSDNSAKENYDQTLFVGLWW